MQTVKENGQRKKNKQEEGAEEEDSVSYRTPDNNSDSATTEKTKAKTKNGKITSVEEKNFKNKITSQGAALFGSEFKRRTKNFTK